MLLPPGDTRGAAGGRPACLSVAGSDTSAVPLQLAVFEHHQPGYFCGLVISRVKHGVISISIWVQCLYQTSRGCRETRLSRIEHFLFLNSCHLQEVTECSNSTLQGFLAADGQLMGLTGIFLIIDARTISSCSDHIMQVFQVGQPSRKFEA